MLRVLALLALLTLLVLTGCDWRGADSEQNGATAQETVLPSTATSAPVGPSLTERVVAAIRSCQVKRILFLHGNKTYVTSRGGRTIHSKRLDTDDIAHAAYDHADACNIVIGIE